MKLDDFSQWKESLIKELSKEETSLFDYFNKYTSEILSNFFYFNRVKNIIKELKSINYNDFINFYKEYINNKNLTIFKILGN